MWPSRCCRGRQLESRGHSRLRTASTAGRSHDRHADLCRGPFQREHFGLRVEAARCPGQRRVLRAANDKQRAMTATRVNYRRGLFRLWVILAALWIGGVALVSGPGVYREFQKAAAVNAAKAATVTDATKGATVSRLAKYGAAIDDKDVLTFNIEGNRVRVGNSFFQLSPEEQQATIDEITSQLKGEAYDKPPPPAPWSSLVSGLWIAILPPLALLSLGAALGWVFSGFRHRADRAGS